MTENLDVEDDPLCRSQQVILRPIAARLKRIYSTLQA